METRTFTSWIDARNASCDILDMGYGWERIGVREGFVMFNRFSRRIIVLLVD